MPEVLGYQFDRVYALPIERYRQVITVSERDAIPIGKRWEGMLCYVLDLEKDFQLRGGVSNSYWVQATEGDYFDVTTNDSDDITEGVVNLFLTQPERTKLGYITVTSSINLDDLKSDVDALGSGVTFINSWSPSGGVFPGGGTTAIGDMYVADDSGTIDGVSFVSGDSVIATVINASTTTFAGNWAKTESTSDVTSVVGLTGVITKTALLSALNVEDGATADMTGSEISAAITTYLTTSDWQSKLTKEEVLDFIGEAINDGSQQNIVVEYDDSTDSINFTVDPFIQIYSDLTTLISGQGDQTDDKLYEVTDASGFTGISSGKAWVRYKGTIIGSEADYIIVSYEGMVSNSLTGRKTLYLSSVVGAQDIDWEAASVYIISIDNGLLTLSDVNLPGTGENQFIEILTEAGLITDSIAVPAYWDKDPSSHDFKGDVENRILVDCLDGDSGNEVVKYRIENLD